MKNKVELLYNLLLFLFSCFLSYNIFFYESFNLKFIVTFLVSFIIFILLKIIIKYLNIVNLKSSKKIEKKEFIWYSLIIFVIFIWVFLSNMPYELHYDLNAVINSVVTKEYTNWHPLFYILLMIKIPYTICENISFIAFYQLIWIFPIMLYFCYFLRKYFLNFKGTIIILLIMLFNPIVLSSLVLLYKDTIYSYFLFLGTLFLIEIYLSNGCFFDIKRNKILFIICSICISNFRHNGIGVFLLMMILLIIFYKNYRKFLVTFLISLVVIRSIITGPIYNMFKVIPSGQVGEMMGIPLNQFSYLYNNGYELTNDQLEMMDSLTPLHYWKERYDISSFNEIRWYNEEYHWSFLADNKNIYKIIKNYLILALKYPIETIKSYTNVTYTIWGINNNRNFTYNIYYGELSHYNILKKITIFYYELIDSPKKLSKLYVIDIGNSLNYIFLTLFIICKKYQKGLKKYLPYVIPISNVIIVMCVIYGNESRLALPSVLCFYPLVIYSLSNYKKHC